MKIRKQYFILTLLIYLLTEINLLSQISSKDTMEINNFLEISNNLIQRKQFDSAFIFCDKAGRRAMNINWANGIFKSLALKFVLNINYLQKADEALKYAEQILELGKRQNDLKIIRRAKRMYGNCLERKGNYTEAMKYFFEALEISDKSGNQILIASDHKSIGLQKAYLKNYDGAIVEYNIAFEIEKKLNDTISFLSTFYILGNAYLQLKDYKKSEEFHEKRIEICKLKGWEDCVYSGYEELSGVYSSGGNNQKALDYTLKSYNYYKKIKDYAATSNIIDKIFGYLIALGRSEKCLPYLNEQYKLAVESGNKIQLLHNKGAYAVYYKSIKEYKKATEYYEKYLNSYDSVFKLSSAEQMAEMSKKYETAKKDKELLAQQVEIKSQQEDAHQKSTQRNFFIIGFGLMIFLSFFIFRSYNQKKKANEEISEQKAIIEEKQKEILDSIRYARRIQNVLITSERYIQKSLERLKNES